MKHISTLVAVPVLACGAVAVAAAQASASNVDPEPGARGDSVVVVRDPGPTVKVDDSVAEGLQAGASAIGGAAITLAAVWAYRRRHPAAVQ